LRRFQRGPGCFSAACPGHGRLRLLAWRYCGRAFCGRDGGGAAYSVWPQPLPRRPGQSTVAPGIGTRAQICQMAEETSHLIGAQTDLALRRPGALGALAKAKMPVLSVTGLKDHAAPPSQGAGAALCAPDGQFCALDGLGHFALMEDPEACADVVQNWFEPRHECA